MQNSRWSRCVALSCLNLHAKQATMQWSNHKNAKHYFCTQLRNIQQYHMLHARSTGYTHEERQEALVIVCYAQ